MDLNKARPVNDISALRKVTKILPQVLSKYKIIWTLGKGFYGKVFLATSRLENDSTLYAIKIMDTDDIKTIENEIHVLQKVKGRKNVVRYIEHFLNEKSAAIVTKYFHGYSFQHTFKGFSPRDVQFYLQNLLKAVREIHRMGYIHGDIKPDNFLFDNESRKYLLIDLGLSYRKGKPLLDLGPIGYIAMESILKCQTSSCVIDIWNVGLIFLSLLSGICPFFNSDGLEVLKEFSVVFGTAEVKRVARNLNKLELVEKVLKSFQQRHALDLRKLCLLYRHKHFHKIKQNATRCPHCRQTIQHCICLKSNVNLHLIPEDPFPESSYDLLYKMLKLDPSERITADEALNHEFFQSTFLSQQPYLDEDMPEYDNGFVRNFDQKFDCMISRFS